MPVLLALMAKYLIILYTNIEFSEGPYIDNKISGAENLKLLNEAFRVRKLKPFETDFYSGWLSCGCNHKFENINVIWGDGYPPSWILEKRNDSLYVYEYLNKSDYRETPLIIKKNLVKSYPWK